MILNQVKKQLITTSHGCLCAKIILLFGKIHLMKPNSVIKSGSLSIIIVIIALSIKVTILEAYIVPTGSMEKTIMTGDFLIGSRFVYGMRTPNWIGIPYTDIGIFIPSLRFPRFKDPQVGDVLIFNYPRDKYVKYVKRCIAGPGDTLLIQNKCLGWFYLAWRTLVSKY